MLTNKDIKSIFTAKTAELISQGFQIHPFTMGGSQGEIARIDFTKDGEYFRLLLETGRYWDDDYCFDTIKLSLGRYSEEVHYDSQTLWNGQFDPCFQIEYAKHRDGIYTTFEEERRIYSVRMKRYRMKKTKPTDCTDALKSSALKWLRKQKGLKTCKLTDINSMTKEVTVDGHILYWITAKETRRFFILHGKTMHAGW